MQDDAERASTTQHFPRLRTHTQMGRTAPPLLPLKHGYTPRVFATQPTLVLLSFVTIVVLLQHPSKPAAAPSATFTTPSLFRAREDVRTYAQPRHFDGYRWGRVCSQRARERYLARFDRPGRPLGLHKAPPSLQEARGRQLVSHIPREVGDGLGHRMCIMNYELHLALQLGVAYSHRVSTYGSITTNDPGAVERLFGWGAHEQTRDEVINGACARTQVVNDTCEIPAQSVVCDTLRSRLDGGTFDTAVYVPHELAECYLNRTEGKAGIDTRCFALVRRFVTAFPEKNTLFITRPRLCFRDYLYTNFTYTAGWFHDKYWSAHESDGASKSVAEISLPKPTNTTTDVDGAERLVEDDEQLGSKARRLTLDARRVNIALHVRRGDFFNYTARVLIPDATYADMAARVIVALHEMHDANVPVTVHVFSEGVPRKRTRVKDNHDVASMDRVYADENGMRKPPQHWSTLIRRHPRLAAGYGVGRGYARADVNVVMHIATDTVQALHDMLAADFFVGSISGLSVQVVRYLARGVVMLPIAKSELMDDELTLSFDYQRNGIPSFVNESLLYERVAEYARENRLACAVW